MGEEPKKIKIDPMKNGYCKCCQNRSGAKCTASHLYSKAVPCIAIMQCSNYTPRKEDK